MIIEITDDKIKLYHNDDAEPYKVLDIIDLIDFWEQNHEETTDIE